MASHLTKGPQEVLAPVQNPGKEEKGLLSPHSQSLQGGKGPRLQKVFFFLQSGRRSPSVMPSRPRPRVCVTLALSSGLAGRNGTISTALCFLASHILGQQHCPSEPVPGASASPVTKPLPRPCRACRGL